MNLVVLLGFFIIPIVVCPDFSDQYTPIKWGMIYLISFGTFLRTRKLDFPQLNQGLVFGLLFIILYLLNLFINSRGHYENDALDWICFIVIAFSACLSFQEREKTLSQILQFNLFSTLLVVGYGCSQWLGLDPLSRLIKNEFPSSLFGFQNMTAEFIGISILLQVYWIYREFKSISMGKGNDGVMASGLSFRFNLRTILGLIFLFACCFYLKLLACRAVMIALVLSALSILFLNGMLKNKIKKSFLIGVLLGILLSVVLILNLSLRDKGKYLLEKISFFSSKAFLVSQDIEAVKAHNSSIRLLRWLNTWEMIKEHPLGIGPGNYEFDYIPYDHSFQKDPELTEDNLIKSPHNGYLEEMAQNGALLFILTCVFLLYYGRRLFEKLKENLEYKEDFYLLFSIMIFVLIDAMFAFPMENAYPFYAVAVFFGMGMKLLSVQDEVVIHANPNPPLIYKLNIYSKKVYFLALHCTVVAIAYFGAMFLFSQLTEGVYAGDYSKVSFACTYFPSDWHNCARKSEIELERREYSESEKTSRLILRSSPNNFIALKDLGEALKLEGKRFEECKVLRTYDSLFENHSSLHSEFLKSCFPSPLALRSTK